MIQLQAIWQVAVTGRRAGALASLWQHFEDESVFNNARTAAQSGGLCLDSYKGRQELERLIKALETGVDSVPDLTCPLLLAAAIDGALATEHQYHPHTVTLPAKNDSYVSYSVIPKQRRAPAAAQHKRCHWFAHHAIVPMEAHARRFDAIRIPAAVDNQLRARIDTGKLEVCIATFPENGVRTDFDGETFSAEQMLDEPTRTREIFAVLEKCRHGVDALILPELQVLATQRDAVADWLSTEDHELLLVVAGSAHVRVNDSRRNRAMLLGPDGQVLCEHDKFTQFTFCHPDTGERMSEDVKLGDKNQLLVCELGILTLAVCLDFCEEDLHVQTVWNMIRPDLILVPALNARPDVRAFQRAGERLHRTVGLHAVVANQPLARSSGAIRALISPGNSSLEAVAMLQVPV